MYFAEDEKPTAVAAASNDPLYFIIATSKNGIKLISSKDGGCELTLYGHTKTIRVIHSVETSDLVITGGDDKIVNIWDFKHKLIKGTYKGHKGSIYSLCSDIEHNMFFSGGSDNLLIFWKMDSETPHYLIKKHSHTIYCLAVLKDKNLLASGSGDKTIILWNYITL